MSIQTVTKEDMIRLAQAEARTKFAESLPIGKEPFVRVAPVETGLALNASGKTIADVKPVEYKLEMPNVDVKAQFAIVAAELGKIAKAMAVLELLEDDPDAISLTASAIVVKAQRVLEAATAVATRNTPVKVRVPRA